MSTTNNTLMCSGCFNIDKVRKNVRVKKSDKNLNRMGGKGRKKERKKERKKVRKKEKKRKEN